MILTIFGIALCAPKYVLVGTVLTVTGSDQITQENLRNSNVGNLKLITDINIQNDISSIGGFAFQDCTGVVNIYISDSVKSITSSAFYKCNSMKAFQVASTSKYFMNDQRGALISYDGKNIYRVPSQLTEYTFPSSVTKVMQFCFEGSRISSIVISRYIVDIDYASMSPSSISQVTFEENSMLTKLQASAFRFMTMSLIRFPKSLTTINVQTHALIYQSKIQKIEFEDGCQLANIHAGFIDGCSLVEKIKFPETLTSMQAGIVNDCKDLVEINIPKACTYYDPGAFVNCPKLARVTVDEGNTKYVFKDDVVTDIEGTEFVFFPSNIEKLAIGPNFAQIADGLLQGSKSLTRLEIDPNNQYFASSDDGILYNYTKNVIIGICGGIKSITINSKVSEIKENAGLNCVNLESIYIEDGLTEIPMQCFMGCTKLSSITLPKTMKKISKKAFQGCKSLQEIPSMVNTRIEEIGLDSFISAGLTKLELPNTLTTVDFTAFSGNNLNDLIINCARDCSFSERSFGNNPMTSVTLSENVTIIGVNMFQYCSSLSSIKFLTKSGIQTIKNYAFSYCGFVEIAIPNTVTQMDLEAFSSNSKLTTVKFEENSILKSLSSSVFINCPKLNKVIIPHSVTSVDPSAFQNDVNLVSFDIESSETFSVINGSLHNIDGNQFILCAPGRKNITVGDTILSISPNAFYYCYVEYLTIAAPITEIATSAFIGCNNLVSVNFLTKTIKSIGESAFDGCQSLKQINLQDLTRLETIKSTAFSRCAKLQSIILPSSITSIGKSLFSQCTMLNSVEYLFKIKDIPESMFDGCSSLNPIIPATVQTIGKFAFQSTNGQFVDIPVSVQTIGENAFANINGLLFIKYCQETVPVDNNIAIASAGVKAYVVPKYPRGSTFHGLSTMYVLKPDCSIIPATATQSFHFTAGNSGSGDLSIIISAQILSRDDSE